MQRPILPVTLALTTLNEEQALASFFSSVEGLTMLPAEISICDGGSRDGTVSMLRAWTPPDSCALVVTELMDANIARGRNEAIGRASHRVVAVTDCGCRLEPDWLERIVAPLLADDSVPAVGGGYRFDTLSRFEHIAAAAEMNVDDIPDEDFLPSSRSMAFRLEAWRAVGGYPEHLSFAGEDTAFCLSLLRAGFPIRLRRDAIVHWRPRPTLRSYIRQHVLYGIGDGEARSKTRVYAKIVLRYCAVFALAIAGTLHPAAWAVLAAGLIAWYSRLYRVYRWHATPLSVWLPAALLIVVKELSILAGFLRGSMGKEGMR
jgi:glycosyltransferase involved in cell wall biosynthesis